MSAASVADFALKLLNTAVPLVSQGIDLAARFQQGIAALSAMKAENRGPTQAEYDALRASNAAGHAEFQALGKGGADTTGSDG